MSLALGLDFGTTNSALALADERGATLLRFPAPLAATTDVYRSVLYFDPEELGPDRRPLCVTGPFAIERYLDADGQGRLLQSIKSYLASRLFKSTSIEGRAYTLEDLIAKLCRDLRAAALAQHSALPNTIVVGRPVRFGGSAAVDGDGDATGEGDADDDYPLQRLRRALGQAGFGDVVFEYEPVAAAYHYEGTLDHDELVLIGDFGGGTSDFCLMRVGPGVRRRGRTAADILGTAGVPLAGDALDSRLVRHLIAPRLGQGTSYVLGGKRLPVPPWLYGRLSRWHHLSFLRSRETLRLLDDIYAGAEDRAAIGALRHLIDGELGYRLYQAVEKVKVALSHDERASLRFRDGPVDLSCDVTRREFEGWIAPELAAIDGAVDQLLAQTGVAPEAIDAVFLTGGTSMVPAVRRRFAARFGGGKLRRGDELTSVASGLALRARDLAQASPFGPG